MRVLAVHNRYRSAAPSGENRVVDQEAALLRSAGHEVAHFERDSDEIDGWSLPRKAALPAQVVWNPGAKSALRDAIRGFEPDLVHVHNTFPLLSPSVLHACRTARVPVVATFHNYKLLCASGDFYRAGAVCHKCVDGSVAPALRHGCYRGSALSTAPVVTNLLANRSAWRRLVSAYVFISEAQRRLLAGLGLPEQRCFVKPNFVPVPSAAAAAVKQRMVVYVGRLDEAKGVPLLLEGWDRYRAQAGDEALRLCIAGSGPLADTVTEWAADRPSVDFLGLVSRDRCGELLARARAAILPSSWEETFGLAAVEAMAAGTAPVATAHGSFPELVTPGVDGVLFPPGSAAELGEALADVDAHPSRYAAYGRNAQDTWQRRFDPERNVVELLRIYRFALEFRVFASGGG